MYRVFKCSRDVYCSCFKSCFSNSVKIEEHPKNGEKGKAVVTINSEQKSKAIGKAGLNIRLASMLTKYDIEIVEIETGVTTSNLETKKDEKISDASSLEALFK